MIETIYNGSSLELYHHGVKGMHWGVRRDPERSANRLRVKEAKRRYKHAKKAYNEEFNKWYYIHPKIHITKEGKQREETQLMRAIVKSSDSYIAKGQYLQAKGLAKNKPKTIAKGKHIVNNASNTKKYNVKVLDLMEKGHTSKEAYAKTETLRDAGIKRQHREDARYKKELTALKKKG